MVCNYDSQINPATHLRPIQTSVPEVLKWFSELSPHTRVEFVCGLLQLSTAPELRFYGSCLEEIARQDYDDLLDAELRANSPLDNYGVFSLRHIILTKLAEFPPVPSSPASVPPTFIIFKNNPNLRSKLILSLSLLKSTNVAAATSYFEILMADEQYPLRMYGPPQCISTSVLSVPSNMKSTISSDESDEEGFLSLHLKSLDLQLLDEIILIYTLAAYHPAFSFDQRQRLYKRVNFLRAISKHYCGGTVKDFNNSSENSEFQNISVDSKSTCLNSHCHLNDCPIKSNFPLPRKYCFCCDRPSLIQECADSRMISNSHFGSTVCHSSGCFYRHSMLHRFRRHSLPSEYMRKGGFAKIMTMPFRNSHVICQHVSNNSEHNKSSLQTYSPTQSSTVHHHESSIKPLRRRGHSGSSTNTNRSSISQLPQSCKCFPCKCVYNEDGNENVKQSKNCIHNPNYLNEVHLWLTNPSRPSIIPNSFNKSCNPTFFPPSVYPSSTFSIPVTCENSLSQTNINIDEDPLAQTNHSCGSNLNSQTDHSSDYADDDTHSSVELCSNPTETLQANGSAAYTDLLQTVTNLASVSVSSRNSCQSNLNSDETCSSRQMNATTPDSTFLFGSEKSISNVVDYCRIVSKRHSSGSSPILTPPSEESGSDAVAVTTSSSEYWISRETPSACISPVCRQFHSNFKSDRFPSKTSQNSYAGFSSSIEFTNSDSIKNVRDIPSKTSSFSSTQNLSVACSLSKVGTSFTFSSTVPTPIHFSTESKPENSNFACSISTSNGIRNDLASSAHVVSTCAISSYLTDTGQFNCNCDCFSQNKNNVSHKDSTHSRVNGEQSPSSVSCLSHVFMEDEKQSNEFSKNTLIHSLNQQPSSCSECSVISYTEALSLTTTNLSPSQATKTSTCLTSTGVCLIQSTSIHTNSPRFSSFAVPPSQYWISPHGQMPFLSSTFYPPFLLSSPPSFLLENPQSISRFPWFYQWTVHPCPPASNGSTFTLYPAPENNNPSKQCETSVHQTLIPKIIQSSFIESNKDSSDCSLSQIDCSTSTSLCNGNSLSLCESKPTENLSALVSHCTLIPQASMVYPSYIDIFRPGFVPFSSNYNNNNNINPQSRLPNVLSSNGSSSNLVSPLVISVSTTNPNLNPVSNSLDLDQTTSKSNYYNSGLNFPTSSTFFLNSTTVTVSSQTTNRVTQNSSDQKSGVDLTTDELQRMPSTLSPNTRLDTSVENDQSVISWPTCEASCSSSWFNQLNMNTRFTTRPESTGQAPTSVRPLSGSNTRTYSPVYSNAMFPRGCLHPHLTNVFYYAQQPAVTLVPTHPHHSSVLSTSHNTTHLNFPPPHTFSSSTTVIPFENYVGTSCDASAISVTSAKSNTTNVSQLSSSTSIMPLSGPLVSTANITPAIFQLHGVPLSPNFLMHPPMYPTFSPPNLPPPVNTPMAVSLWSTLGTGSRIVSCYSCGRPGHKANVCPTKWSNNQFSENTFSLNCAPTK